MGASGGLQTRSGTRCVIRLTGQRVSTTMDSNKRECTGMMRKPKLSRLHPDKSGIELALGDLEAAVMRAVWAADEPVPVEAVRRALIEQGRQVAYTTVMTTMSRLHKKGLLNRELKGRAYLYSPAMSEDELAESIARAAIDGVVGSLTQPAVAYFVEALSERDPRQLDLLAELIERKRRERDAGKR